MFVNVEEWRACMATIQFVVLLSPGDILILIILLLLTQYDIPLHIDWFPVHILSVYSMCFYQIWHSA